MADRDYYEVLGVARDATPDQLKKAYRALARKHHPDVNPGSKDAERLFKETQAAYDLLNDPEKRALYDRFGHAAFQGGPPPGPRSAGAEWAARSGAGAGGFENIDLGDFFRAGQEADTSGGAGGGAGIFDELLGRMRSGRPGGRRLGPRPGRDINASLAIPFVTAVLGGETTIEVEREPGHREALDVKIPPRNRARRPPAPPGQGRARRKKRPRRLTHHHRRGRTSPPLLPGRPQPRPGTPHLRLRGHPGRPGRGPHPPRGNQDPDHPPRSFHRPEAATPGPGSPRLGHPPRRRPPAHPQGHGPQGHRRHQPRLDPAIRRPQPLQPPLRPLVRS